MPLMGIADVTFVGRMETTYIAAVSIGTTVLNTLYLIFSFFKNGYKRTTWNFKGHLSGRITSSNSHPSMAFSVSDKCFPL